MMIRNGCHHKRTLALCGAALLLLSSTSALAQLPDSATRAADPGRAQEQLRESFDIPDLSARVEVRDLILQTVPEGAEEIFFEFTALQLDDYSVYTASELEATYAETLGTTISLADVYAIATQLTNKYRNDGYILTQVIVPPQTIEDGIVRLRVVEGFIENITVESESGDESSLDMIRYYATGIDTSGALNVKDLERHLLLISDLPGVDARSIISPSATQTGAADLRIIASHDPSDARIGVNNFGSRYLGPLQFNMAGSLNSYFGNSERITAQVVWAPDPPSDAPVESELAYFALTYEQPVPALGEGSVVALSVSHTDTEPGFDLKEFEVEGISKFFSAKVTHPFIRSRIKNLDGHISFDWRDVESRSNVDNTLEDHIRAVRAGLQYEFLDTFFGAGINAAGFEISQGLEILGSSNTGDANLSRGEGEPAFTKATANLQRFQRLTSDVNMLIAAEGQWSDNALLSSEEFGVGGQIFGRGYDPSEVVGDRGIAAKVELQWNEPYTMQSIDDYQLYGFYDVGRIWNRDATDDADDRNSIASTGLGVRADLPMDIDGDVYVAFPLTREVQTHNNEQARFFFSLSRSF